VATKSIVRTRFKEKKENPRKKLLIPAGSLFHDKTIPEPLIFSGLSFFVAIAGAILRQTLRLRKTGLLFILI
jgi:hypothetical protein